MLKSNRFKLAAGLFISAIFLYFAFRKIDLGLAADSLRKADYRYMVPAMLFLFFSLLIRAFRWGILIAPLKKMSLHNLFAALCVGYMANNALPFRMGELLRAYSIGRLEDFSKASSFATIVVERILDVIALLILMGAAMLFQEFPDYVRNGGLMVLAFTLAGLLFLVLLLTKSEETLRFYRKVFGFMPDEAVEKGEKLLRSLLGGLIILKNPQYYLMIVITSVAIWFCYMMMTHMTVYAFGFHESYGLSLLSSITLLIVTGISVSIPSSPGYIGTYHYLVMLGMAIYSVPESEAFSFAVILHLLNIAPVTLVGLYYFIRQHLSIGQALEENISPE